MAKFRMIDTKFWSDNYISDLDPIEKLLFIYFFTNPYTNISGIYELSLKQIALDTGIDKQDMLPKIIKRFSDGGKIFYIDGWVYVKNFQKHQKTESKKIQKGIETGMSLIPSYVLETINSIDTLSIPYTYPSININSNSNSNSNINIKDNVFKLFKNKSYITIEEVDRLKLEYPNRIIDDYIEDVENYIVNNPKGKSVKDVNLTIRNRLRKNGVKKRETTIIKAVETDDFFTSLQKEIGV